MAGVMALPTAVPALIGDTDDLPDPSDLGVEEGILLIKRERVEPLLEYLRGGELRNNTNLSFVEAYSVVAEHGNEGPDAQKLFDFFSEVVRQSCQESLAALQSLRGSALLPAAARYWEKLTILIYWMQRVFQYLDRFFLREGDKQDNLFSCAVKIHAELVYSALREPLTFAMVSEINRERDGQQVDTGVLRNLVELLATTDGRKPQVEMRKDGSKGLLWSTECPGRYTTDFEPALLAATEDFYKRWTTDLFSRASCPEALRELERRLEEEEARLSSYLHKSSADKLRSVCMQTLISARAKQLVEMDTGCKHMLEHGKKAELAAMFRLFRREPKTLSLMTAAMASCLEQRCRAVVDEPGCAGDSPKYVQQLLDLKADLDDMVRTCFDNEAVFQRVRNRALEKILNKDDRCAKNLALHTDSELKRGLKGKTDDEAGSVVDAIVGLLAHLKDKDVFLEFYRRSLSRRLLNKASVSEYAEERFFSKLKGEVGPQAVQRLQFMLTDMALCEAMRGEYAASPDSAGCVEHEMRVLRTSAWPVERDVAVVPCREMQACMTTFEKFYNAKHVGRKLFWLFSLGTCEVAATCYKGRHTFVVSPYQCLILMLLNLHPELTFTQALDASKIPEDECRRHVQSMAVSKQKLLLCSGEQEIGGSTVLSVNRDFSSDKFRVVISLIKDKGQEKVPAGEPEQEDTSGERKHVVDAAIVRVMKARRQLSHTALLDEVMKLCILFKPQPAQIKRQVDYLIEREFLKKDPGNANAYIYVP